MHKVLVSLPGLLLLVAGCGRGGNDATPVGISVTPATAIVHVTQRQQFSATVHNSSNPSVLWSVSGAGCGGTACGSISANGLYTAPAIVPNPAQVNITAAAVANTTISARATVTILPAIVVMVSPVSPNVRAGKTQQFTATVRNANNAAVTWSVAGTGCSGAACGVVNGDGLYSAPPTLPSPATVTVTATSVEDTTKTDAAAVMIVAGTAMNVPPAKRDVSRNAIADDSVYDLSKPSTQTRDSDPAQRRGVSCAGAF